MPNVPQPPDARKRPTIERRRPDRPDLTCRFCERAHDVTHADELADCRRMAVARLHWHRREAQRLAARLAADQRGAP